MAARKPVSSPFAPANHATAGMNSTNNLVLPGVSLPSTASLAEIMPVKPSPIVPSVQDASRVLPRPSASPLPSSWSSVASSGVGELRFNVRAADGRTRSSAVWSRVNVQADAAAAFDSRNKTFGGVPVTLLRRTVINRMVAEGGWVTNDVQRQFGERRVLVVTAQSVAANGEPRAWTFYFTESEGQVYSLATNAPAEAADALASESEQAIVALGSRRANNSTTAQFQH